MGVPREVWVCSSKMGTPVYVYDEEAPAVRSAKNDGALLVHRYVLARPKREAVAWVVSEDSGYAYTGNKTTSSLHLALRFKTREEAQEFVNDEFYPPSGSEATIRLVKLVRPVKP